MDRMTDWSLEIHRWPVGDYHFHPPFSFSFSNEYFLIIIYIKYVTNRLFCWMILSINFGLRVLLGNSSMVLYLSCFFVCVFFFVVVFLAIIIYAAPQYASFTDVCAQFIVRSLNIKSRCRSPSGCMQSIIQLPVFHQTSLLCRSHQRELIPPLTQAGTSSDSHWE